MWKQITAEEAAKILLAGGKVDNGFYQWGGTIQLRDPQRWRKARKHKSLIRKLKGVWNHGCDGWWIYA